MSFFVTCSNFLSLGRQSEAPVEDRTIGVVNLAAVELRILRSLLTLLEGKTQYRWKIAETTDVDLLIVGRGTSLKDLPRTKNCIKVHLLGPNDPQPTHGTPTLARPIRATSLLRCLEEVAATIKMRNSAEPGRVKKAAVSAGHWSRLRAAALQLRTLSHPMNARRPFELVANDSSVLAVGSFAIWSYISAHDPAELVTRIEHGFERTAPTATSVSAAGERGESLQSLDMLCWRLGHQVAKHCGLAPWLDRNQPYSLLRWPDFKAIGKDHAGVQIASLMTQSPVSARQLTGMDATQQPNVAGFLTSASLCGLLVAGAVKGPRRSLYARAFTETPKVRDSAGWLRLRRGAI
jgi:hypothetical protein